jgi:multiple antibiotic resistance protein
MLSTALALLIMLNPFALFIYLTPVMKDLNRADFMKMLSKATIISFVVLALFLFTGEYLFSHFFQINFESFRLFGGITIFSFAWLYVVKGQMALVHLKEDIDDLASKVALPFMVGAGTISLVILLARESPFFVSLILLIAVLAINFLIILFLLWAKESFSRKRMKVAFDKNMEILMRLMGFFIGAIGVDMIITAVKNLFF